jgi:hypothetical protein
MRKPDDRITILAILDGWQQGCWNVAKTGKPFAIEGVDPTHYEEFFSAICNAYRYRWEVSAHRVNFDPIVEATAGGIVPDNPLVNAGTAVT